MTLQRILTDLTAADIELHDAGIRRPTLDDVFMRLTGHRADEDGEGGDVVEARTREAEPPGEAEPPEATGPPTSASASEAATASAPAEPCATGQETR
nr:hypothetical protein GCM10023233_32360 [Brevibacterium otitidis]